MSNIIKLEHVHYLASRQTILEDINLTVDRGEYLGIIGPNGAGKTTLLKIILGLVPPASGQVFLFGQRAPIFRDWPKIGYVPQKVTSFDSRFPITVSEVVSQGRVSKAGLGHQFSKHDRSAIKQAIARVGLESESDRLLSELSGGQAQRVFIARALASEPELLILDEPTAGVDREAQEEFYKFLSQLNREQKLTLILVSHDIDVVVNEVSSLACINQTLVYHGSPKRFMTEDYLKKLYGKERKFIIHGH